MRAFGDPGCTSGIRLLVSIMNKTPAHSPSTEEREKMEGQHPATRLGLVTYLELVESPSFREGRWREDALCIYLVKEEPQDYQATEWFPPRMGPGTKTIVPLKIRLVCSECPVRIECLSYAIWSEQHEGIWAGHSPRSIKKMIRKIKERV